MKLVYDLRNIRRVVRCTVRMHTFEDTLAFLVAHDVIVHFYTFYTSPASVPRSVARRQMQMVAFVRLFRDFDFFTRFCESPAAGRRAVKRNPPPPARVPERRSEVAKHRPEVLEPLVSVRHSPVSVREPRELRVAAPVPEWVPARRRRLGRDADEVPAEAPRVRCVVLLVRRRCSSRPRL